MPGHSFGAESPVCEGARAPRHIGPTLIFVDFIWTTGPRHPYLSRSDSKAGGWPWHYKPVPEDCKTATDQSSYGRGLEDSQARGGVFVRNKKGLSGVKPKPVQPQRNLKTWTLRSPVLLDKQRITAIAFASDTYDGGRAAGLIRNVQAFYHWAGDGPNY